jgi:hypothetical protein
MRHKKDLRFYETAKTTKKAGDLKNTFILVP